MLISTKPAAGTSSLISVPTTSLMLKELASTLDPTSSANPTTNVFSRYAGDAPAARNGVGGLSGDCVEPYILPECVLIYGDVVSSTQYTSWRLFMLLTGIALAVGCMYRLIKVYRCGSVTQKGVFPTLLLVSGGVIFRGVDPHGYKGLYPSFADRITSAITTALLYSITFLVSAIWVGLLTSFGTSSWRIPRTMQALALLLILGMWGVCFGGQYFFITLGPADLTAIKFNYGGLLTVGSLGFIHLGTTGFLLHRRIEQVKAEAQETGKAPHNRLPRNAGTFVPKSAYGASKQRPGPHPVGGSEDSAPEGNAMEEGRQTQREKKSSTNLCHWWMQLNRVLRLTLMFVVTLAALTIFQTSYLISALRGENRHVWSVYNICLRENDFDQSKCHPEYPSEFIIIFQVTSSILLMWAFWKLPRDKTSSDGSSTSIPGSNDLEEMVARQRRNPSPTIPTHKETPRRNSTSTGSLERLSSDFSQISSSSSNRGRLSGGSIGGGYEEFLAHEEGDNSARTVTGSYILDPLPQSLRSSFDTNSSRDIKVLP